MEGEPAWAFSPEVGDTTYKSHPLPASGFSGVHSKGHLRSLRTLGLPLRCLQVRRRLGAYERHCLVCATEAPLLSPHAVNNMPPSSLASSAPLRRSSAPDTPRASPAPPPSHPFLRTPLRPYHTSLLPGSSPQLFHQSHLALPQFLLLDTLPVLPCYSQHQTLRSSSSEIS